MKAVFLLLFLIFCTHARAQDFKQHIVFLASDSLHGRAPGTEDELKAANYIAAQFDSAKCRVAFQKFPFANDSATNVFGFSGSENDSTIIISAHYDGLGYGGKKSREIVKKGIHNGADDNASGVAMMIELAKWIACDTSLKYNFVFAAYSAHEAGLFGSEHFAKSKLCDSLKIRAVINFDMVGRLDKTSKTLRVSGAETDTLFHRYFYAMQDSVMHFRFDDTNIPLSDLKPFAEKNIPVLNLTTGVHDDYHRSTDDEHKINYEGLELIFKLMRTFLSQTE